MPNPRGRNASLKTLTTHSSVFREGSSQLKTARDSRRTVLHLRCVFHTAHENKEMKPKPPILIYNKHEAVSPKTTRDCALVCQVRMFDACFPYNHNHTKLPTLPSVLPLPRSPKMSPLSSAIFYAGKEFYLVRHFPPRAYRDERVVISTCKHGTQKRK